jgi:hypothetical protein
MDFDFVEWDSEDDPLRYERHKDAGIFVVRPVSAYEIEE